MIRNPTAPDWGDLPPLPRPAGVDCGNPGDCEWRPYVDEPRIIHCETLGCGAESTKIPKLTPSPPLGDQQAVLNAPRATAAPANGNGGATHG